jgi:hypothetical protein
MKSSTGGVVTAQFTAGYGGGLVLGYNFDEHFGIQSEILYTSISQKYKEVDVIRKINLRYVNIPLMLQYNTGKYDMVNFNISAGPQLGVSVGSSVYTSSSENPNNMQGIVAVKKGDLGFAYGAGLDFALNPTKTLRLDTGFRGVYGLIDVSDNNISTSTSSYYILDKTHVKTYSLYVGISYLF